MFFLLFLHKTYGMENPFYLTGIIPSRFFCDREAETLAITSALSNRENVLLTAERKIGKTQLIRHIFDQKDLKENCYLFYIDIYSTSSLRELVYFMGKEIFSSLVPKDKKALKLLYSTMKSFVSGMTVNPVTGKPEVILRLGDISRPELTLEEIFQYLDKAEKRCIFAIDEFQQIARYQENNTEALLRTYIQKCNNCQFIFSGSDRHVLERMFTSYAHPFYNSAKKVFLDKIDEDIYVDFATTQFRQSGRELEEEAARYCYEQFEGYTYYMHKVFHDLFSVESNNPVSVRDVDKAIDAILEENSHGYSELVARLTLVQKQTLAAIAKTGKARKVTSGEFIKRNALPSPSSVQKSTSALLDNQLITFCVEGRDKVYSVSDKFMEKWLRMTY